MRVLQLLDSLEVGGAQRVALGLSDWLVREGHEVTLITRSGDLLPEVPNSVEVVQVGASVSTYARSALQVARRLRPDIVHSHQRPEALIGVALSKVVGCIPVEHAHTVLADRSKRVLSFRSSRIFAVSNEVAQMVELDFGRPSGRIIVVSNTPALRHAETAVISEPPSELHIIGVGRMTAQKDPLRFVDTIAELSRVRPVSATWVGDGPLSEAVRQHAQRRNVSIDLVGYQTDVVPYIDGASAILMTSRWEGMPLVALEALARGRVLVAPRVDGLAALVGADEYGLGYDANADGAEIARLIDQHLDTPEWEHWHRRGPRHIRKNFSENAAYRPVLAAYRELILRPSKPAT